VTDDTPTEDALVNAMVRQARRALPIKALRALRATAELLHRKRALTAERWAVLSDEITTTKKRALEPWRN
jgi:hypothetical protein